MEAYGLLDVKHDRLTAEAGNVDLMSKLEGLGGY